MTTEDATRPSAEPTDAAAAPQPYAPQPQAQQPYGGQSPYYAAPGYGPAAPPRGLSIASMVCGIVGVVLSFSFMGFLPALAGVILGHIGRRKEPEARGFSLAGLITGYVGLAISLFVSFAILAALFIPFFLATYGTSASYYSS